jgi:hypothetical protein
MTQEDKYKLGELVLDYDFKVINREQARREHYDYLKSCNYKCGSDESVELGNKVIETNFAVINAAESIAKFISEKIKEIN